MRETDVIVSQFPTTKRERLRIMRDKLKGIMAELQELSGSEDSPGMPSLVGLIAMDLEGCINTLEKITEG